MTTDQKIKLFRSECQRFIEFFGLHEWQIQYKQHDLSDNARAMCSTSGIMSNVEGDGQQATLSYDIEWIRESDADEISICAFHEVMELMFMKLRDYSTNNQFIVTWREVDDEFHRIIRRFENKIYPLI